MSAGYQASGSSSDAVETKPASADQAYLELVSFLQDQRLDVQKMAADGVLSETEDQDFLGFCQRYPRKVAKPLLRLVENSEELSTTAKKAVATAVEAEGNLRDQEKAVRQAATEAATAMAAGNAALQAMVNLSGVPAVRDELVTLSAPRRLIESMRGGWMEGRSGLIHWQAMVLANLTNSEEGQKAVCTDEQHVLFLMSAYVAQPRPPPREDAEDPLRSLGKVMCNLCAVEDGRKILANPTSLGHLANEVSDRERRLDAIGAFRNLCLDEACHQPLVDSAFMCHTVSFLYPLQKVDEEHRKELPAKLLEDLKENGSALTTEGAVRAAAAECVVGLCQTEVGRAHLRVLSFGEIMRAWDLEEEDDTTKASLEKTMKLLSLTEEEYDREQHRKIQQQIDSTIEEVTEEARISAPNYPKKKVAEEATPAPAA